MLSLAHTFYLQLCSTVIFYYGIGSIMFSFFPTVESAQKETALISKLIAGVADNKFVSLLQQHVGNTDPDKVDIIQTLFKYVKTIPTLRQVKVKSSCNNSQLYRVVSASIFYKYLKFAGQKMLSAIIFQPAPQNMDHTTNQ